MTIATSRPDADQSLIPRPSWSKDVVAQFNKRGLLFKVPSRTVDSRLQRWSDHMRGGVFGAAIVLALVAAYVFTTGGGA